MSYPGLNTGGKDSESADIAEVKPLVHSKLYLKCILCLFSVADSLHYPVCVTMCICHSVCVCVCFKEGC